MIYEWLIARREYESQRQLPERNFAKDHSFEEWLEHIQGLICGPSEQLQGRKH